MNHTTPQNVTVASVRDVVVRLGNRLEGVDAAAARALAEAGALDAPDPVSLLELRSALVRTRPVWEASAGERLAEEARRSLAGAKRLAIDLPGG